MSKPHSIDWSEPLDLASRIPDDDCEWVLFYSAMQQQHTGRYSFLAHGVKDEIMADHFKPFEEKLTKTSKGIEHRWFGYLAYELKHDVEQLTRSTPYHMQTPHLHMRQFHTVIKFDHQLKTVEIHGKEPNWLNNKANNTISPAKTNNAEVSSPITKDEYIEKVETILQNIRNGDLYQANLTRKFNILLSKPNSSLEYYSKLSKASPAPYSALVRSEGWDIISSSPEQFLTITSDGYACTRPIKGSMGRKTTPIEDQKAREALEQSEKDKAENLMIVDLMRNDMSRASEIGSVKVERLHEVTSYETIHHMSSTIISQKRSEVSTLAFVKSCFPPGSMTGTPKIKAMELCNQLEHFDRGIYSGSIGWFDGDGACDLSVVIRTIIRKENEFELQVGGGIVADSTPEGEWQETMDKAKGMCTALGIDIKKLMEI